MSDEPWSRLADHVRRRREELHLSQQQLGEAAGTTGRLISDIERQARTNFEPATLRAVARALGWTPNSVKLILAGEEPEAVKLLAPDQEERLRALERQLVELRAELKAVREERAGPDNGPASRSA